MYEQVRLTTCSLKTLCFVISYISLVKPNGKVQEIQKAPSVIEKRNYKPRSCLRLTPFDSIAPWISSPLTNLPLTNYNYINNGFTKTKFLILAASKPSRISDTGPG